MNVATAYGAGIESDYSLGALSVSDHRHPLRLTVTRVATIEQDGASAVRPCTAQNRNVHIVAHPDHVVVQVDLLLSFRLFLRERRVEAAVLEGVADSLVRYWILQQILPLFLLLNRSTEFLHGMAVSVCPMSTPEAEQSCLGFLGESHAGKSTLLSYFLAKHHALVTDDHLALSREDYATVLPAPPFYRAYRAIEDLGVKANAYSAEPTTLRRLYLIEPGHPRSEPRVEPLSGMAALAALFPNIHYSLHNSEKPDFFPLVEDRFRGLADLIRRVPFARLHVPRSLNRLHEVYAFIVNQQGN